MKKLIAILMTLALIVSGCAVAEMTMEPMTLEEPPVNASNRSILVEFVEPDSTLSYVLLGAGDGAELMASFGADEDEYEDGYDRMWQMLTMMEPAVTVVGLPELTFSPDANRLYTEVSAYGSVIAHLAGLEVFAMTSEEASGLRPEVDDACALTLWNAAGSGAYSEDGVICPNCGGIDDGSEIHDEVVSRYCDEGHTLCMGDPIHHCEVCGRDYECSRSNSHTECAECKQAWCYKEHGDHTTTECGHRGCQVYGEEDKHEKCLVCGEYLCNGEDHWHAGDPEDVPAEEPETETENEIEFGDGEPQA